ncbi:MAG: hypothetical protein HKO64_02970 [Xanthomonadales bacterium]|nr:hypothetical protein [Xanthomonadales bacterium]
MIRAVHFSAISQAAFIEFPLFASEMDMHGYWEWSDSIIAGDWLGKDTWHPEFEWMAQLASPEEWSRWWGDPRVFQQEPVYPYLIALGRTIGLSLTGIILLQLLLGALQPLATFFLTRLVFREDGPALVSALFAATYGPLLLNQGALLRDWTAPLLASIVLAMLLRAQASSRGGQWFWPGLVLGFTLMTYSTILLFLPAMLLWLVWVSRNSLRQMSIRMGAATAGLVIGFMPLLARNLYLGVSPFSISNRLPEGIVSGIAADSNPLGMTITQSLPGILEKSQGSAAIAAIESVRTFDGDWLGFGSLMWEKFRGLVDPFEIPNNLSYLYGQEVSPIMTFMPDFGWLLPLGILGVVLALKRGNAGSAHGLMLLFGASMLLALMINLVLGRYRLAISAFFFVYAGWAVWQIWSWVIARRFRQAAVPGVVLAGIIVTQQIAIPVQALRESAFFMLHPPSYFTASSIYMARGRPDQAVAEWKRMQLRASKLHFESAADAAVEQEQSVRLQWLFGAFELGRKDLVDLNLAEIDRLFDLRRDSSMRDYAMGVTYFRIGRAAEARSRLQRFLREYPQLKEAEQATAIIGMLDEP